MPTYVLLSTLTPEGRRTLHSDPDRLDEVNKEITDFGCNVVAQYAVLGRYDFVTVIEAPDNEAVAHLSVDLGSRGTVNIMTLPAIPMAQLRTKLKGPKQHGTQIPRLTLKRRPPTAVFRRKGLSAPAPVSDQPSFLPPLIGMAMNAAERRVL